MKRKEINRWLVLISAVLINICIGASYAWSVFQKPIVTLFDWSTPSVNLAYTLSFVMVPFAMIVAGKIQEKVGPRKVIFISGFIYGVGIMSVSLIQNLFMLYLTYGVLGGIGIGAIYTCTVANTVKFFPDKRGFASGLVVAGFGSGAFIIAPIASFLIEQYGVLLTFRILGIAYLCVVLFFSIFIQTAPQNYRPAGSDNQNNATTNVDKSWREMLKDPLFYVLWVMYTIGTISGLMIIGHASSIAQEVILLSPQTAAMVVAFMSLANTGGRILFGGISDKIGRYNAILTIFIISGVMMLSISRVTTLAPFVVILIAIGLSFGGIMGIFPTITADVFGSKNLGVNYGIMFTGFGAAAIIGPRLASYFKFVNNGDYSQAFLIAAFLSILGILLTIYVKRKHFKSIIEK